MAGVAAALPFTFQGGGAMADYYDLGSYGRPITTTSADAQLWFDRGLIWCYGYNHEAALSCFEKSLEHDARCAMQLPFIAGTEPRSQTRCLERLDKKGRKSLWRKWFDKN